MKTSENHNTADGKRQPGNLIETDKTTMSGSEQYMDKGLVEKSGNQIPPADRRTLEQDVKKPRAAAKKPVKKKNSKNTVLIMLLVALAVLVAYYYITAGKTKPSNSEETRAMNKQAEELLDLDLENSYPENPKKIVEIYSKITQSIYSEVDDKYIKDLGAKLRLLYDDEFLAINPDNKYYNELLTNIATWRDKNRTITKYIVLGDEYSKYRIIDGVEYQTEYVLFTFKEEAKSSQYWAFLLRKNKEGQWKIAGWEAVEPSSMS